MLNRMLDLMKERAIFEVKMREAIIDSHNDNYIADEIGMTKKEVEQYSFLRAVDAVASGQWRNVGIEREASEATEKLVGRPPRGFYLPPEIKKRMMRRDLSTSSAEGALGLNVLGDSFISLLRNSLVCRAAGATLLSNLRGDILIPKQTGTTGAYWITEGSSLQSSQPVLEQLKLSPKTVGGYTEISRKLLVQSSIDVEFFVMEDLAKTIALAIDKAAIYGDGNLEPLGILNYSGIGELFYQDLPTWSDVVALETSIYSANVMVSHGDSLSYVASPAVKGKLKCTPKTVGEAIFLAEEGGKVNGYNAFSTNQLAPDELLFGKWNDLIIGEWTATDILIDPYSSGPKGSIRIIALQDVDIAVRYPQSFAVLRKEEGE